MIYIIDSIKISYILKNIEVKWSLIWYDKKCQGKAKISNSTIEEMIYREK